jgi:peptidase E
MEDIPDKYYILELLAHSYLKQNNGKTQYTQLSTKSSMVLLDKDEDIHGYSDFIIDDHYITVKHMKNAENDEEIISIFCQGYDELDTVSIPKGSNIYEIKGKWALLTRATEIQR